MILLQVHPKRRAIAPLERDAPRAVDVDRVALRPAAQGVKVEAWLAEGVDAVRRFEDIEPNHRTALQIGRDARRFSRLEQFFQSAMPEARDHDLFKGAPG